MYDPSAAPRRVVDADQAWADECLARERREYVLVLACGGVLFPLWFFFDLVLEPSLGLWFVPARAFGTLAFAVAAIMAHRSRTVGAARAWFAAGLVVTSSLIAVILPVVDHFSPYLIGYTAFFWGCVAVSWPLRASLALFGWQLALPLVALVVEPGPLLAVELLSAACLLPTAAALTAAAIHARRRAHRAACLATHALAGRNVELEIALARLGDTQARLVAQEKLSALGRLLAGLSHEINNPLNVIKNNLDPVHQHVDALVEVVTRAEGGASREELARLWVERELDWRRGDIGDALRDIGAATDQIMQIHGDLRTFIRGESPDIVTADVAAGIRATAALIRRRVPDGVHVELDLDPLPLVDCRPGQLNQVWLNLVQNALDAVGGAGTISIQARDRRDRIELSVTDTGPGVAPEFRHRLFEPFATTKGPGHGTGLGLAISYQIVERHGGRLYVDDTWTSGARFVVELMV